MTNPIRACITCGQSFWSTGPDEEDAAVCQTCRPATVEEVPAESTGEAEKPRFISLSALPPERRMPPRAEKPPLRLKVPTRLHPVHPVKAGGLVGPGALAGPVAPSVAPVPPVSVPPAALPPLPRQMTAETPLAPQEVQPHLGFNCPSCYTVLIIKDPENYDGRAAPCPYCSVCIIPPRIAPPTPFTLIAMPTELSGNPPVPEGYWRPFGKNKEVLDSEVLSS